MTAFTISVYQKKRDRNLEWTTLGLGPLTRFSVGNNPTRISRTLADELRGAIKELRPTDVPALELVPGRRLVRVHLELTFKASSGPARVSGLYPFITEPRWIGPGERALVVYHPKRQEDWFVLREDLTIADHARRFLRKRWERIDAELARETLLTDGRDVLRAFSFSERAPQLIDRLPSEEDVFADLIAEERRRERADVKKTRARKPRYGRAELRKVGVNVTFRVADGLEPLGRPRSPWREQLARLATGPRKSSVVLVGPEGVGKTTLLLQLVRDLLESDDYLSHRNLDRVHEVWRTSARRILAGMSYVGDWEKRCVQLVSEATDPRVVLLVEDLHSFARAGRTRDSDRCLADVFRGPVARGDVTILAEATPSEWQRLEEQAPAFADRFATIRVAPTSPRETIALMLHAARELEPVLKVRFDPDAYRVLHQLAPVLNPSAAAPGVAVDMLRALAADHAARLPTSAEATDDESDVAEIGIDETYELLSRRSGLPTALLRLDAELDPEDLERRFAQHVMGQPDAVRAAVDLVARIRAGLTAPGRPFASYLFTGPTGTGKTQMAKAIAGFLYGDESRLVRIDMGEMSGPDAVGRLIGDAWDPRGSLTDPIRHQPFSVVLLDEIEKAHPSVLYLLLQLLEDARLTGASGELADFQESVIVMTSNLGARSRAAVGFGERADAILSDVDRAVREFFPPELFNRIDRVVRFRPLTPEIAERVTEKELAQLLARRGLSDRRVFVFAHPDAVKRMSEDAFDAAYGARSVKRFLDQRIGGMLVDLLAGPNRGLLRIARIYGGGSAGYRHEVQDLAEAAPTGARYALESLLDAPMSALRTELPALRAYVDALRADYASLASARGAWDAARYHIDALGVRLDELADTLETLTRTARASDHELRVDAKRPHVMPGMYGRSTPTVRVLDRRAYDGGTSGTLPRHDVLSWIAEARTLRRALARMSDPHEHRVIVELTRVGQGRHAPAYERPPEGLFEWLTRLYASARGEVLSAASRSESGAIVAHAGRFDASTVLRDRPAALALEVEGLAARSFLAAEDGCHVWSSALSGSEIVRVRIAAAPEDAGDDTAATHLRAVEEASARFERALDRGEHPLPENPAALRPVVRKLTFDPPVRAREAVPIEVEDYATAFVMATQTYDADGVLAQLLWLGASREEPA